MDAKEARLIVHYYEKLIDLSYDERDIYGFLILLRPYSPEGSPVHEFANFVAHRERDRGHIYAYLLQTKSFFNAIGVKLGDVHEVKEVFTEQEIAASFNSVVEAIGAPPIPGDALRGVTLCIVSLLQGVKIADRNGTEVGELHFAYDKNRIYLFGVFSVADFSPHSHLRAPVLSLENWYIDTDSAELQIPGVIEVVNDNRVLVVRDHHVQTTA
jgi:hypothetical protein